MQRVRTDSDLIHPLMRELETLYAETSVKIQQKSLIKPVHHELLKPIVEMFKWGSCNYDFEYIQSDIQKIKVPKFDKKNIIVCFSGGKDSFAVARHYQKKGYNVYLYHLKGLNATYCGGSAECYMARECAEYMGLPIIVEEIGYSGYHEWTEHPMKNMLLLNRALSYGMNHEITNKIAVGTFKSSTLIDSPFEVCGGDTIDMMKAYEKIIKSFMPSFKLYIPSLNYQTAYNTLLKEPEALKHISSCLTPNRFKNHFRKRTEGNYKISLLPARCGCCWKDAVEYMWIVDHGIMEVDRLYYLHCLEVLRATLCKERRWFVHYVSIVWDEYMFYPISKSKLSKEITNATFTAKGKIKCADTTHRKGQYTYYDTKG